MLRCLYTRPCEKTGARFTCALGRVVDQRQHLARKGNVDAFGSVLRIGNSTQFFKYKKDQCCPVKLMLKSLQVNSHEAFRAEFCGVDLNVKIVFRANYGGNSPGVVYEHWQNTFRSTDGFPALERDHASCRTVWRRLISKVAHQNSAAEDYWDDVAGRPTLLINILWAAYHSAAAVQSSVSDSQQRPNWSQSAKFNHYPLWIGSGLTI